MKREAIATDKAPAAAGAYSQAICTEGLVFTAGQIALDPATGELVGVEDVQAQARRVMDNLREILQASGSRLENVVKATLFLTEIDDFPTVNQVYAAYFEGTEPPARSAVQVAGLPRGAKVKIEMIALR